MNEIQDSGLNQQLVRRLNITDVASPAASLAPEIFPVYQVSPPSQEDELLRQVFMSSAGNPQGGVAAQYSHMRLANIAGAGILVMLDYILLMATNGSLVRFGVTAATTLLSTQIATGVRDTRVLPTTTSRQTHAVLSSETNITPPFSAAGKRLGVIIASGYSQRFDMGITLQPGTSFDVGTQDVNQYLAMTCFWRERRAQPSELG